MCCMSVCRPLKVMVFMESCFCVQYLVVFAPPLNTIFEFVVDAVVGGLNCCRCSCGGNRMILVFFEEHANVFRTRPGDMSLLDS